MVLSSCDNTDYDNHYSQVIYQVVYQFEAIAKKDDFKDFLLKRV